VTTLCEACYDDFTTAHSQIPDSLKQILELEKQVLPVRLALLEEPSLFYVHNAIGHFTAACDWTKTTSEKYDEWEQEYNTNNRFQNLPRPGQEFLKLVMDVVRFSGEAQASVGKAEEEVKAIHKFVERYDNFRRQHGFIKDRQDFRCVNHKFMVIKEEEAQSIKAAGISISLEDERMTTSFLQELLNKYSDGSVGSQGLRSHISDTCSAALSQYASIDMASHGHPAEQETHGGQSPGPQIPRRSFTVAVREPVKGTRDFKSASIRTDFDFAPSAQLSQDDRIIHPVRRAQTLPLHFDTNSATLFLNSTKILHQSSGSVLKQLYDLSHTHDIGALAGHVLNPTTPSPTVEPSSRSTSPRRFVSSSTSRGISMETGKTQEIVTSQEPEEIRQATTAAGQRTVLTDISTNNRMNNETKVMILYRRLFTSGLEAGVSTDRLIEVGYALHVTEALMPGFIEAYFAFKEDERRLTQEVEDILKSSSDSSDNDSDDEDGAVASGSDDNDDLEDGPSSHGN
jgi:hypothetical protein